MDDNADLHDWELLHGPDFPDNYACVVVLDEPPSNFAIKDDYFAFNSGSIQRLQSEESDEGGVDSDNPSCPDSDSNAGLESSKEHLGFLSDESSDRQRLEASVMEMGSEKSDSGCGREEEGSDRSDLREMTEIGGDAGINPSCPDSDSNAGLESSKERLGFLSDESSDRQRLEASVMEMESEESDRSDAAINEGEKREMNSGDFLSDEHVELGILEDSVMEMGSEESDRSDTEIGGDAAINEGEKREKTWWNVPLGLLKYCLVRMRPVWSLSIAAAVVGLVMLWRKLYRMKQKSRIIPLKLAIDEKKTSQFAARSARLNAAFSVVRRMPAIRPSLQEGVATQWAALPLR